MKCAYPCALLLLAASTTTQAVDRTWDNFGGGLLFYDTAGNWNPAAIPSTNDNVFFTNLDANPALTIIIGAPSQADDVNVTDGSWIFTGAGGATWNSSGTVTIDDAFGASLVGGTSVDLTGGVFWDNVGATIVGDLGFGTLTISDSDFRTFNLIIGDDAGAEGEVTVDGASSLTADTNVGTTDGLVVGNAGIGMLNVTGGAFVEIPTTAGIPDLELGVAATGDGTLDISGAGSRVRVEDAIIGREGTGAVNISDGGILDQTVFTSPDAFLGTEAGASGTVTVTGDGSQWNTRRALIGQEGTGRVDIAAGARVRTTVNGANLGDFVIGDEVGGDGKVAVHGSGVGDSLLDVDDNLIIGNAGLGVLNVGLDLDDNVVGSGDLVVDSFLTIGLAVGTALDNRLVASGADVSITVGSGIRVGDSGRAPSICSMELPPQPRTCPSGVSPMATARCWSTALVPKSPPARSSAETPMRVTAAMA